MEGPVAGVATQTVRASEVTASPVGAWRIGILRVIWLLPASIRASRPPPWVRAATHTASAFGAAAMAPGLALTGMAVGSPPGSARATCCCLALATQRLPLANASPGPPWPTGPDPDAGMVSWTRLASGSITVTVPSCRLATQTDPPPAATAVGPVPTARAATGW